MAVSKGFGQVANTNSASPQLFANVPCGTPATDRDFWVWLFNLSSTSPPSAVTGNGRAMTMKENQVASGVVNLSLWHLQIHTADEPTSEIDLSITTGISTVMGMGAMYTYGGDVSSATYVKAADVDPVPLDIATVADGAVLAYVLQGSATGDITWTGLTEDGEQAFSTLRQAVASALTTTSETRDIAADCSTAVTVGIAVFLPAVGGGPAPTTVPVIVHHRKMQGIQ